MRQCFEAGAPQANLFEKKKHFRYLKFRIFIAVRLVRVSLTDTQSEKYTNIQASIEISPSGCTPDVDLKTVTSIVLEENRMTHFKREKIVLSQLYQVSEWF